MGESLLKMTVKLLQSSRLGVFIGFSHVGIPFGMSTAPGEYQARMAHEILKDFI